MVDYQGDYPQVTKGALDALEAEALVLSQPDYSTMGSTTWEGSRSVTLLGKAYTAVETDFAAPDGSFVDYLPPNVDLAYLDQELRERSVPLLGAGASNPVVWDAVVGRAVIILEERLRTVGGVSDRRAVGVKLVNAVFGQNGTLAVKFADGSEREAYRNLYAGVVGVFRNDYGHHLVDPQPGDGASVLALANLLLKMLEDKAK